MEGSHLLPGASPVPPSPATLLLSCEVTGASSEIQALGQRRKAEPVSSYKSMTLSRFPGRHSALGQHQQFRRKFKATCAHVHTHTHSHTHLSF